MSLLPDSFKPINETYYIKRFLCAETPKGHLAFCSSREYPDERIWRVKPYIKDVAPDISYWIVGLDFRGILVLPAEMIHTFCLSNGVELNPTGMKWKLAFKESNGKILMTTMDVDGGVDMDVTDHFICNSRNNRR